MKSLLKDIFKRLFPVFAAIFAITAAFYFIIAVITNRTADSSKNEQLTVREESYELDSYFDAEETALRDYCYALPDLIQKCLISGEWQELIKGIDSQHLYERCGRIVSEEICQAELDAIRGIFSSPVCALTDIETGFHGKSSPDAIVQICISDDSLSLPYTLYVYRKDETSFGFFFEEMESGKFGASYK